MTKHQDSAPPVIYEIRLKGHLSSDWSHWFDDLAITYDDEGNTLLTGPVVDQAALHGLLDKVRDLGLYLTSVRMCREDPGKQIE
ncbi:MAG: hypothetical protein HY868_08300 [Chloroflexi bacterium]|nr:hypothetical protein [Chloroflexota bacterium]